MDPVLPVLLTTDTADRSTIAAGPHPPRVLLADDQPDVLEALRLVLKDAGFEPDSTTSIQGVRDRLRTGRYDLLLMDLNYARDTTSGREGLELLAEVHAADPLLPIIVMTGWGTIETAVEAMRLGARTFIHKPWNNDVLGRTIRREVEDGRARRHAGAIARRERDDARLIQRALLPSTLPSPTRCDIAAIWEPASDFGGDCYDVLALGPDRIGVSIADVSGKGLPAAFLMSNLQASFRAFAASQAQPSAVAASINRALCANPSLRAFATFFYAVIDSASYTISYTNAGHNPPVLVRASGDVERLTAGGIVLGVFDDAVYEEGTAAVGPGDRLVLFTDGMIEAERDGAEFGDDRLVETILAHRRDPVNVLAGQVAQRVREFTGGSFADDATLISLEIR